MTISAFRHTETYFIAHFSKRRFHSEAYRSKATQLNCNGKRSKFVKSLGSVTKQASITNDEIGLLNINFRNDAHISKFYQLVRGIQFR